jgi:haloalkane dehalogenase
MVAPAQIPGWMTDEYPFTPHVFRTPDGAGMSYLDEGPRHTDAVLMLHGNPTWSYYYRHLVQALRPTRRCLVPDHVGMGASEKPAHRDYTLASRIRDGVALVDSLGLRRVDLVVHDWGGAIGFGVAAQRPTMIGRLVVLNTAAFTDARIPKRIALCRAPWIGPGIVRGLNGFAWPATFMAMHRRSLSAVEKRGYLWPYGSWADRVAVNAFVQDIPLTPAHPSWAPLKGVENALVRFADHPALLLWGGRDFCFNDHFLARWQKLLPRASSHLIAEAGHYVLDDAREEVIPRIREFLGSA